MKQHLQSEKLKLPKSKLLLPLVLLWPSSLQLFFCAASSLTSRGKRLLRKEEDFLLLSEEHQPDLEEELMLLIRMTRMSMIRTSKMPKKLLVARRKRISYKINWKLKEMLMPRELQSKMFQMQTQMLKLTKVLKVFQKMMVITKIQSIDSSCRYYIENN